MKRATGLLIAASLALAGSVVARAEFFQPLTVLERVNDDAVLQGMPRLLSDYGFFNSLRAQTPNIGVTAYRLNTPLFSDGAEKLRFVYLPEGEQLTAQGEGLLGIPVGGALIKTFAFAVDGEYRLIETRVLLHRADGWVALPYRWNNEQTDATLAIAGARLQVSTPSGEAISYRIPNKNQCKECHGLNGDVTPIGPKARNLSHEWLKGMMRLGRLDAVPDEADQLPLWEERAIAPVEEAARGYLDVNCAHCHRPGATASNSGLDLRWDQADPQSFGVHKRPVAAGRGAGAHEFSIEPGKPDDSIIVYRMSSTEPGVAMPELGKATVDEQGVEAVRRWIASMEVRR